MSDRPFSRVVNVMTGEVTIVEFTDEEIAERNAAIAAREAEIAARVPAEVSPYQARKALKDAGVLPAVMALMASLAEIDDARMAWEYATVVQRQSPFISTLGASLGLTETQIDDLFRAAAQVN